MLVITSPIAVIKYLIKQLEEEKGIFWCTVGGFS